VNTPLHCKGFPLGQASDIRMALILHNDTLAGIKTQPVRYILRMAGIIPEVDMIELQKIGVGKLFGPGASTQDAIAYIKDWISQNKN